MKQVIKDIFIILHQEEKRKLWLLAIADICISLLDIFFLIALLYVVSFYTQPARISVNNKTSFTALQSNPVLLITVFFVAFTLKNIAGFTVSKMQFRFVYDVASRISRENLQRYFNGLYSDYVNIDSSVANRHISQEPIEFAHYVLNGVQQVFSQCVLVLITIMAVFIFNPVLFPLLLLLLVPPVLLVTFLMKRKLDAARLHGKKTSEKTIQHLQEALTGFVEGNIYNKTDFLTTRYHRFQVKLNHYLSERLIIQNMPPRLIEVFAVFGLLILIIVHFFTAGSNSISLVTIGALMVAAYKIIPGIVKITNIIGQVKTYSFAATDLSATKYLPAKEKHAGGVINSISFNDVHFKYSDKAIVRSFSFAAVKGDFIVLSGISGKGKTTLVNLLLGFLQEDGGAICVNGIAMESLIRQRYWSSIAYVKQQPFLLHASIIENIVLNEGDYDKEKLKKITSLTGIDAITVLLPEGLKTIITENGKNFSGGQRQRISFARALYRDFDLLILDEPFNELDEASELEMLSVVKAIAASGKIVILITHNTTAFSFANKKIVMNE